MCHKCVCLLCFLVFYCYLCVVTCVFVSFYVPQVCMPSLFLSSLLEMKH